MIRKLIEALARELAAHDGVPVSVVHLHGAASNLMGDIAREKDAAIAALIRPAATAIDTAPEAPQPAAEPVPQAGAADRLPSPPPRPASPTGLAAAPAVAS